MSKNTSIEWTHHSWNPWWGCVRVSPACTHCYAEVMARRFGSHVWGKDTPRRFFDEAHWQEPLRWDAQAQATGVPVRVFCASMADVFEPRDDLEPWREKLWALIEKTPHLIWTLLTKRPSQITRLYPWVGAPRNNVWLGATVENQKYANLRIEHLARTNAVVRFLSCEPLLGALDLNSWLAQGALGWVVTGGESGQSARPTHPTWFRSLRDQCQTYSVPFSFHQWGHWSPAQEGLPFRRRMTVQDETGESASMIWRPKADSGRTLDGRIWAQRPDKHRVPDSVTVKGQLALL